MKHVIAAFCIFLYSCKSELPEVPSSVIPPAKMVKIMADIHLADAVAETKAQQGSDERSLTASYHQHVYQKHGITRQQYVESMEYYTTHPEWMNKIYDDVAMEISKQQNQLK